MADRSEPQLTDEEAAELVERINGNPNLHPEASPPERTEELVERVALAMFLVAREEPGNEIYEESFEDMQLGDQNFARRLARAALQSLGYAEMERVLLGLEAWFAGYVANGGKGADEELAMVRTALSIGETDYCGIVEVDEEGK